MKICLAGFPCTYIMESFLKYPYHLESFYASTKYIDKIRDASELFLLDSGAFSFMTGSASGDIDFEKYTSRYADFINEHHIEHFFEMDVDCIVGLKEVERLRTLLEKWTGRLSIPVWHRTRGVEYFKNMCDRYPYVAIGGIASKEILPEELPQLKWFIEYAHARGSKIHGLGISNFSHIHRLHFDSVDSTTWHAATKFRRLCFLRHGEIYSTRLPSDLPSRECRFLSIDSWKQIGEYFRCNA